MPDRIDEPAELAEHMAAEAETLPVRPYKRRADRIETSCLVIVAIAVVLAICYVAKPVLIVVLVSILLAFMLTPIVDGLQRVRVPRGLGAMVALLLLFAVVYGTTYFFYNRAVAFVHDLPKYTEKIRDEVDQLRQQAQRFSSNSMRPSTTAEGTITVQQQTD